MIDYPSRNIGDYVPGFFNFHREEELDYEHRKYLSKYNIRQAG